MRARAEYVLREKRPISTPRGKKGGLILDRCAKMELPFVYVSILRI